MPNPTENPNCNAHPGFFSTNGDHQISQGDLKRDPSQVELFNQHFETLQFEDYFNSCFVKLSPEDSVHKDILREAALQLYPHIKTEAQPFNCSTCTLEAKRAVETGMIPQEYGDFKLIFVHKGSLAQGEFHFWIEMLEHQGMPSEELAENYFDLKRLIIDFTGLSPVSRDHMEVKHKTYQPFFGTPELGHVVARERYLTRTRPTLVHNLTEPSYVTAFVNNLPSMTMKWDEQGEA